MSYQKYAPYITASFDFLGKEKPVSVGEFVNGFGNTIIKTYLGTALKIDPLSQGQSELATASYYSKIENSITRMKSDKSIEQIDSLIQIIKSHDYRINILEDKSEVLWNMIEVLSTEPSAYNMAGQAMIWGGEMLSLTPFAPFAGPVMLLGSGLKIWDNARVDAVSEKNLAYGRALFVDNIACNAIRDNVSRSLKKFDEKEDKVEKFQEWLNEKEKSLEQVEDIMIGGDKLYYGVNFFDVYDSSDFRRVENLMGIIAPYIQGNKIYMIYIAMDFKDKTVNIKEDCFMKNEFQQTINCLRNEMQRNSRRLRYVCTTPFLTENATIRMRLKYFSSSFMRKLPDDPISARALVQQFVQNGGDIQG